MAHEEYHLGIKALIKNDNEQYLVLKVNRQMLNDKTLDYWDIPGGRVEKEATIEETRRKEILEETGVSKISDIKKKGSTLANIRIPVGKKEFGLILFVYECKISENSAIKLSEEHVEYSWMSSDKALKMLTHKYPREFLLEIFT